ncbi:E3 ubiquitin-protein ligase LNX [Tachyglossus aculeatus]|uniref:E3 ubiquitin-protein ligase LNX n=1 Tax=Tachyglossus aculeatus TaxID=9261 RepID=UPI0018F6AFD2|nr:E3 ubiquitin-protein ligase LNX [Tachyglossus aculeatus]
MSGPEEPGPEPEPLCVICGQSHPPEENHFYSYTEEVDDDLICHVCLQALLDPLDTPCGHTYCALCLTNFLLERDFCPVDRKPLVLQSCRRASVLVHKLLDKLPVTCPFTEHCSQVLQRCQLQRHFQTSCKGASHYGLTKDRKRRSQDSSQDDGCQDGGGAARPGGPLGPDTAGRPTGEPGLDNPAYVPAPDDGPAAGGAPGPDRGDRSRSFHFERSAFRSRSFKRIHRALSILRRTKSGSAVASPTRPENPRAPEEAFPRLHHLIPAGEITSIKISRAHPGESLAIRVVGGRETPLAHIIVQHIYRHGVVARDGRLLPGDMILKVDGLDIGHVPHHYALALLRRPGHALRLTVLRERRLRPSGGPAPDAPGPPRGSFHLALDRHGPGERLGVKLASGPDGTGVYVAGLLEGGLAARDGQLRENDRLLAVNGRDLRHGGAEAAAQLIQASEKQVHLVVSRQAWGPAPLQEAHWTPVGRLPPPPAAPEDAAPRGASCHEKVVSVHKEPDEPLGMTVAGGAGGPPPPEWDLPLYVLSVEPGGLVARDGRIKTGDVLLSVNGTDLTGVSRGEAVALLKSTASLVVLRVLEVRGHEPPEAGGDGRTPSDDPPSPADNGERGPTWVMWLELPWYLSSCRDVSLRRTPPASLGFSLVGGDDEELGGNKPFFIKSLVEGTPAYNDGRIRCGDILLAVNGQPTAGLTHARLTRMLKGLKGRVTLTLVSWPGTFL